LKNHFFGATVEIDCTSLCYCKVTEHFIFHLLFAKNIKAVNATESFAINFGDQIFVCKQINASATISRSDGSFGFSLIEFNPDFEIFTANALAEIEKYKLQVIYSNF
jgi:chloramphenicol O-acetyltransferase type A